MDDPQIEQYLKMVLPQLKARGYQNTQNDYTGLKAENLESIRLSRKARTAILALLSRKKQPI